MSAIAEKQIAIVGGGPGGLTLARLLQKQGANVAVYERDQSRNARVQGSALDLHEDSGLAALEAAGLTKQFWDNYRPDLNQLRLTDTHGNILPATSPAKASAPRSNAAHCATSSLTHSLPTP
jgi:2-polyprenyl-6-methoxyphenol hydroxylase-like FAD-dependent oxidoreductase